jgi:uncharacterized protein (DUF4415 family)
MVDEVPKRLSIAEKRAMAAPLVLTPDRQVKPQDDEVLSTAALVEASLRETTRKRLISLRVDPEVIDFFKTQGPGYQTRMNAVLTAYMQVKKEMGQA